MLVDLKRTVAYICPVCSNISSKYISVFNFSGTPKVRLICPTHGCHEECVTITPKNGKYKFDIECPLCGGTHSHSINAESFWHKKILTYKCPAAGMDIFFSGERREVERMLEDNSDIYSDIVDDFDDDETEFNILFAIIEQLHKLSDEHLISCSCGSENISMNVMSGSVILACPRCGRSTVIESSEENLTRLLNTNQVVLGS